MYTFGKKAHERCSISVIRKLKWKSQGNINTHFFFFIEWVKFKRLTIPNVSENLKQNSHALLIDISKDTIDLAEKKIDILKKVSYTPTIWFSHSTKFLPKGKVYVHQNVYIDAHSKFMWSSKKWKQYEWTSADKWINCGVFI